MGEMIPGMAYLVRRLLENTSNQSWLRAGFFENVPDELLSGLAARARRPATQQAASTRSAPPPGRRGGRSGIGFARRSRGWATACRCSTSRCAISPMPAQRERFAEPSAATVPPRGRAGTAPPTRSEEAIARAAAAFPAWRDRDAVGARGDSARARPPRCAIAATSWRPSWSARRANRGARPTPTSARPSTSASTMPAWPCALFQPRRLGRLRGRIERAWYQPRGVAAVISPWNFPSGHLHRHDRRRPGHRQYGDRQAFARKPAASPGCCARFSAPRRRAARGAAVSARAPARAVGRLLVRDPRVAADRLHRLEGSRPGHSPRWPARRADGQGFVKKVVCEMGGKNAIIVDDSADLDEAVLGVRQSAFGYSGQKCSACSRAIVLAACTTSSSTGWSRSTRSLVIGDPMRSGHRRGPGDRRSGRPPRSPSTSRSAAAKASWNWPCEPPAGLAERVGKPYIGPHIFSGIRPAAPPGQRGDLRPGAVRDAGGRSSRRRCDRANATAYKLTGGVFSRKPSHLEPARRRVPRGQSLFESRHHRGPGGPAAVRRLRPLGHGHPGRRPRLPAPLRRARARSARTPCATASPRDWRKSSSEAPARYNRVSNIQHALCKERWNENPFLGRSTPFQATFNPFRNNNLRQRAFRVNFSGKSSGRTVL